MDNKKAVAAAVAATIAASGAAVEVNFDNPADLLQSTNIEPKVQYIHGDGDQDGLSVQDEDSDKQRERGGSVLRQWILKLPIAVRAVFVLPFWCVGSLIMAGGSLLMTGLSPVLHWVLSFVLMALVIAGMFVACTKAIFPDLPLGKILNRHSVKWILIVAAAAFAADLILGLTWSGYAQVKAWIQAGLILLSLASLVVWFSRREHRQRKLQEEAAADAMKEPEDLVFTSLGQTFTIRPRQQ